MRKIAFFLLGAALLPGSALAEATPKAAGSGAHPGLQIGFKASAADPSVPEARQVLAAASFTPLDFELDRPRRHGLSSHAMQVTRERAARDGNRLGTAPAFQVAVARNQSVSPYIAVTHRGFAEGTDQQLYGALTRSYGMAMNVGNTVLLLSYDRSDAPVAGVAPRDLFAAASHRLSPNLAVTLFGTRGLSAGSPNMVVGSALSYRFR
jgi:hypothetical protein